MSPATRVAGSSAQVDQTETARRGSALTNPNLTGRVGVRFVIGSDGRVTHVADGGSDLPDANVVSCVSRAFYDIGFPKPEGGIVTVVYPIVFQPD